jgi:hypothetical protein
MRWHVWRNALHASQGLLTIFIDVGDARRRVLVGRCLLAKRRGVIEWHSWVIVGASV